jgi:hypothetical protein
MVVQVVADVNHFWQENREIVSTIGGGRVGMRHHPRVGTVKLL